MYPHRILWRYSEKYFGVIFSGHTVYEQRTERLIFKTLVHVIKTEISNVQYSVLLLQLAECKCMCL